MVDKNIGQGAATTLYACLTPDLISGEYYSDCAVKVTDAEAVDAGGKLRKALWEATEEQLKAAKELT